MHQETAPGVFSAPTLECSPHRRRRLTWLAVGLLTVLTIVVGCLPDESEPDTAPEAAVPFVNVELNLAVPSGFDFRNRWQILLDEWAAQTGSKWNLSEYTITPAGVTWPAGEPAQSHIWILPTPQISEWITEGRLGSIPSDQQSTAGVDWLDIIRGLRERLASYERQPIVLPISSPSLICYYRSDLLARAGLQPPRTWDDYLALAKSRDIWAENLQVVEPWSEDWRATMFLSRAMAYVAHPGHLSVYFDVLTGEPIIDHEGYVECLQDALQALQQMPESVRSMSPADCRREILEGRAALAVSFETGRPAELIPFSPQSPNTAERQAEASDLPSTADAAPIVQRSSEADIGFSVLPGRQTVFNRSTNRWEPYTSGPVSSAALTGFAGLSAGVGANLDSTQAAAAWNLLALLTRENPAAAFPPPLRTPCRESQVRSTPGMGGPELPADEARRYVSACVTALRDQQLRTELPVTSAARFRDALTRGISAAMTNESEPAEALSAVKREWEQLADKIGKRKVLNSYRRSVGLFPLPSE